MRNPVVILRRPLVVMAVLAGLLGAAGWVATASQASSPKAGTAAPSGSLRILWVTELPAPMQAVVKGFEKAYPKVHVNLELVSGQNLQTVLTPQVRAGNPPDIAYTCGGAETPYCVGALDPKGDNALLPLSGPWATATTKAIPDVAKFLTVKGKYYAAPLGLSAEMIFYNKTIFSSLGLKPPKLFSQLLSDCEKIAATGKTPFGFQAPITTPSYFMDEAATHFVFYKDPNWAAQRIAGKTTFSKTAGWHRVLQAWLQMKNDKCFSPGAAGETSSSQAITDIAAGNTAMLIASTNTYPALLGINPKLQLGAFDMPGDSVAQRGATVGITFNLDVFRRGGNPTAARAFINFAERPSELKAFNQLAGTTSVNDFATGRLPSFLDELKSEAKYRTVIQPSTAYPSASWVAQGVPSMIGLLTGQVSISQELVALNGYF